MNPLSDSFSVTLKREGPSQPWGFRLQGGVDFTTALCIQSVNGGSIAARAGLQAGDAVLQINGRPSDELKHEQAKREIVTSGNKVFLVVQRGAVKIWKPRVTLMSELRPKEFNLRPNGTTADEICIQKTSLAANKPEIRHFGIGFNRTAKPFGSASLGAGSKGSGIIIPTAVYVHNNKSTGMHSTCQAHQCAVLTGRMQDLTVSKAEPSVVGPSSAFLTVRGNYNKGDQKRSTSPNFLTVNVQRSRSPVFRNVSPTPIDKTSMFNQVLHQMEISKDAKEGEETLHQGTSNPCRQSPTFQLLEKELADFEAEQGSSADDSGTRQPVIQSVKARVYDPSQHEVHQEQHTTRFKCCRCGKNLKKQGCFLVQGQMYCKVHAKDSSQSENGQGK